MKRSWSGSNFWWESIRKLKKGWDGVGERGMLHRLKITVGKWTNDVTVKE